MTDPHRYPALMLDRLTPVYDLFVRPFMPEKRFKRELIRHAHIAARLYLSEGTIRNHPSTAIQKLGVHNRMEAARLAEEKGWLSVP